MLNIDPTTLAAVVNSAKLAAANEPRWLSAIDRAAVELQSNPFIEWQDGHLLIGSPSSAAYQSNGVCQCTAFTYGQPCWHRAAARLYVRYTEAQSRTAKRIAYEQACAELNDLIAY